MSYSYEISFGEEESICFVLSVDSKMLSSAYMLVVVGEDDWSMVIMTNIQCRYCETSYLIEEESKSVFMSDVTENLEIRLGVFEREFSRPEPSFRKEESIRFMECNLEFVRF